MLLGAVRILWPGAARTRSRTGRRVPAVLLQPSWARGLGRRHGTPVWRRADPAGSTGFLPAGLSSAGPAAGLAVQL